MLTHHALYDVRAVNDDGNTLHLLTAVAALAALRSERRVEMAR